jgi:hypothetical protein
MSWFLRGLFVLTSLIALPRWAHAQTSFDPSYWNLLLHYQKGLFGGWASEAHNADFFISPNGRTDPEAELKASLQAISEKRLVQNQPFECVFPARYHYLKSAFALEVEESPCARLKKWKTQFAGESATVVFATSYLGNVASIFGHAFLKIDTKPGFNPKGELLDLGISFAAKNDPDDNPITFAWKGLTGGYLESYSVMTYFTRLGEYHNIENRDIWEYKLRMNAAQVDRLLEHAWELQSAQMNYFFPNKNCAYHLWVLLQVANPNWHIADPSAYWVMPADGIKILNQVGAVSEVKFRPSTYHKLKQKILAMSDQEKAAFEKSKKSDLTLFGNESSLVLEGLLDYQQFTIYPFNRELQPSEQAQQDELFAKLTTANISDPPLPPIVAESEPDLGQGSRKASLMVGNGHGDNFFDLEFRPMLHDLLDNDDGYTQFSQIEAGRTRIRYSEIRNNISLQELEVVNIVSLVPVDSILMSPSWLVQVGGIVPPDSTCATCLSASVQGGIGISAYLLPKTENAITFAFLKLNAEDGAGIPGNFRAGPSELIGFDVRLGRSIKFLTELEFTQYFDQHLTAQSGTYSNWTSGLSWNAVKNFELRLNGKYQQLPTENYVWGNLAAGVYF